MGERDSFLKPDAWRLPTVIDAQRYRERLEAQPGSQTKGSAFGFRKQISPLFLYKYLHARFGDPNGFMTFLKKPRDSDNLVHWDYLIFFDEDYLNIQSVSREIQVFTSRPNVRPRLWAEWVRVLKSDAPRYAGQMGEIAKRFEKWSLMSLRFARIADAAAEHHEILVDAGPPPTLDPPKRSSKRAIATYTSRLKRLGARANLLYNSTLALDLMTPILAEAFINLIIFILAKPEIRDHPRRMDSFLRQQIDLRVFDLHLKCDHFISQVDEASPTFRAFKKVMDRRNDIIHSNVNANKDTIETVFFDGYTPLFPQPADALFDMWRLRARPESH